LTETEGIPAKIGKGHKGAGREGTGGNEKDRGDV